MKAELKGFLHRGALRKKSMARKSFWVPWKEFVGLCGGSEIKRIDK